MAWTTYVPEIGELKCFITTLIQQQEENNAKATQEEGPSTPSQSTVTNDTASSALYQAKTELLNKLNLATSSKGISEP